MNDEVIDIYKKQADAHRKRIAELEEEIKESRGLVSKLVYILQRSKPESYLDTAYFKNTLDAGCDYMRGENVKQSEGGGDECPSCKGNDKNSRLVMDATLGMDYECSDDWHTVGGGADE